MFETNAHRVHNRSCPKTKGQGCQQLSGSAFTFQGGHGNAQMTRSQHRRCWYYADAYAYAACPRKPHVIGRGRLPAHKTSKYLTAV